MKRALIITLALSIILSLAACGINDNVLVNEINIGDGSSIAAGSEQAAVDERAPEGTSATTPVNLTEVEVEPQCKPSVGFSFGLPEGWTYEIKYSDDEPTSCTSASLRPETAGIEGGIIIEYIKGFGVCGTGLREEQIDFNGYEAVKGFYDDNQLWSFIALKGDYRDCVIINSAENWYEDFEDEIGLILDSVQFKYFE